VSGVLILSTKPQLNGREIRSTVGTRLIVRVLTSASSLWLRTDQSCYITQYDITSNSTSYTASLPYCGPSSEHESLTLSPATIRYKAECRICPEIDCDVRSYLPEETDVDLTCWTKEGQVVIDDPYWMKTTNNCYVPQKHLWSKPDVEDLDWCGPIPLLEMANHWNENGTSEIDATAEAQEVDKRLPIPEPGDLVPSYLINVTVGEDFANCHSEPDASSRIEKRYVFNQEVWLQCITERNGTYWSETIDFCYVDSKDFWESPEGDCKS
jgi:hypothetical protein